MSAESHVEKARAAVDRLQGMGVRVCSLCADSRAVAPGDVFVAYPGARADARRLIPDALARGAAAVLWERRGHAWDEALAAKNIGIDGLHGLAGYIADLVYGRPSRRLRLVGVTGTNGKTSVSHWIAQCMEGLGRRCGVIGTLGTGFPGALRENVNTTPDAIALHRCLAQFVAEGARSCAMEVSSIGLDQGRVNGAGFDTAVFTNLTRDHLEYHGTMEAYAAAKTVLFEQPGLRHAVLNLDDAFGRALASTLRGKGVERIGYTAAGTQPEPGSVDELIAADAVSLTAGGLRFDALTTTGRATIAASLVGRFNVSNLLAVLGALRAGGVVLEEAAGVLSKLSAPPGRMQMQGGAGMPLVVVDYAHTPDALEKALGALRETARARGGRLICVFGCGGDRDPGKRPVMGAVAARGADRVRDHQRQPARRRAVRHRACHRRRRGRRCRDRRGSRRGDRGGCWTKRTRTTSC